MTPADTEARTRALDRGRSFIVQAPAGSGKTELLIQRYLALLAIVERPEQVVAITFTRKAAAEMRGRVMQALREAAGPETAEHGLHATTLALARAALVRDRELAWSLLLHPQRMRIDTLDALNAWLAQQLPVLSGGVTDAALVDDATDFYKRAARRAVERLQEPEPIGAALQTLFALLGNDADRLETLLAAMLPSRDQWLRHIAGADPTSLRARLTAGLTALRADRMRAANALLGPERAARVLELGRHAARHASRAKTREILAVLGSAQAPTGDPSASVQECQAVAHLLLTAKGEWRRSFTKSEGFGPENPRLKSEIEELSRSLQADDELRAALASVSRLPDGEYAEDQWRDLLALRVVLLQLVAELRVLFAEQNAVDFVELAMAAERALGHVDEPSDLLLAIDRRIHHILVDEFQDTSHAQFRLLELLTSGWTPGDGRSLFLVGDPAQSIYRFRDADMSLFLRAKHHGVGAIRLESLTLERNFRAAPAIVDWTNDVFATIFPDRDREELGIARFHPCAAVRARGERQWVAVHALASDEPGAEIRSVVRIVEEERARSPTQSIAILVQSRRHLRGLRAELRVRGLAARAVEIESLAETEIGQDLIGLTRALAHLGDRIAWLAVLRAPWCGIGWGDLHALCADRPELTIWQLLHDSERLGSLSADGRARAAAICALLDEAERQRAGMSFAQWVETTWRALDGPAAAGPEDFDRVRQYFDELSRLCPAGDLDDPATLESFFLQPRRQPDPADAAGTEIMTVHRAKGLEFDTVILFGLSQRLRGPEPRALHWQERTRDDGSAALLLGPYARDENRLTHHLLRVEIERDLAERARLLYVATTRARERLHLVARLGAGAEAPPSGTLLAFVWPHIEAEFRRTVQAPAPADERSRAVAPPLVRFANGFEAHAAKSTEPLADTPARMRPEYQWAGHSAVQVGTVVHAYLERIARSDVARWSGAVVDAELPRVRRELTMLGVAPRELDAAARRVRDALQRVVADPRGRWILTARREAQSEMRLTIVTDRGLEHLRLDRTFVDDDGIRWVIDYKTSLHEGANADAFMDNEVVRYRTQLERYATAIASVDSRPIRVGIYFPLLTGFRDWVPAASVDQAGVERAPAAPS